MVSTGAIVIAAATLIAVLWAVFGADPCAAIYAEDDYDDEPDPRARWRDPWGEQ